MAISSMGMGSGIDIRGLVNQLVAAERAPAQQRLDKRQQEAQAQLSAYGSIRSALSSFQSQLSGLRNLSNYGQMSASAGKNDAFTVSASSRAAAGSYQVAVNNLAQAQSVASGHFDSRDATFTGGSLTFTFGTVTMAEGAGVSGFARDGDRAPRTIEIREGASLTEVRDAINAEAFGVTASIVNDGQGERLVFSAADTGAKSGFIVEADLTEAGEQGERSLADLAFHAGDGGDRLTLNRAAEDASMTINGLEVRRPTNEVSDAIEGLTFNLRDVSTASVAVDVKQDKGAVQNRIRSLVEGFNKLQQELNRLTRYNAETQQASVLTGSSMVRGLNNQLRGLLTNPLEVLDNQGVRSLGDLGIMTKRDGTLEINNSRLERALDENFEEIGALFAATALVGDSVGVEFRNSTAATQPGEYAVEIEAPATRGLFQGGAFGEAVNDGGSFFIEVNGQRSARLSLPAGEYTQQSLVAELQALINDDNNLKRNAARVNVRLDDNGNIEIVSERYGARSTVKLADVQGGLVGLLTGESTAGEDVKGTINGLPATGEGRDLTSSEGPSVGLTLRITGENPGGSVIFSSGILGGVNSYLTSFLASDGAIRNATDNLDSRLREIQRSRDALDRRMQSMEQRLSQQFTAMDVMIGQLNQTSQYLGQQLSALQNLQAQGKK